MDTMTGLTWSKRPSRGLMIAAIVEIIVGAGLIAVSLIIPAAQGGLLTTGIILTVIGLGLLFVARKSMARYADAQRLKTSGLQGRAAIVGMRQTGVSMNEQPQVELNLQVEVEGQQPYTVTKKEFVPLMLLGTLTSGVPLPVSVDPANPSNVVINWENAGNMGAASAAAQGVIVGKDVAATPALIAQGAAAGMLPSEAEMDAKRQRLRTSGRPGTALIQSAQPSGQTVGNYQILIIDLVLTINGVAKDPVASGAAVPNAFVSKVVPGMVVPVRLDPTNDDDFTLLWEEAKPPSV